MAVPQPPSRLLAILAFATLLTACGKSVPGSSPAELRFSIVSGGTGKNVETDWRPILADMSRRTGLKVTPNFSGDNTQQIEALRFKETDAGWFSNLSGLEAVRQGNGEVFARAFEPAGADGDQSALIVPAKNGTTLDRVLKCDRTLTLGMGDALSTSATLAPLTYLFGPRGIDPVQCFKQVRSGFSHQASLFAVAKGQFDVATNSTLFIRLNRQKGRPESGQVRVIWTSPTLPEDPIIWRKDLDPALKEKVRQFFLTVGQGDGPDAARQRAYLAKVNIGGFKAADDSHLLPVREMEATAKWLAATQAGDPAKIAVARQTLDAIIAQRTALEARTGAPAGAQ